MNQRARDVLTQVALSGKKHVGGRLAPDQDGRQCVMGFLLSAAGLPLTTRNYEAAAFLYGLTAKDVECPHGCPTIPYWFEGHPWTTKEIAVMVHMNNDHDDDPLTIARKMPETD